MRERLFHRRQRGFITWDATVAVFIGVTLLMALSGAVIRQQRSVQELARNRVAIRLCDEALLALQAGQRAPDGVQIERLPDPAPGDQRWVRVSAAHGGRTVTLTGLVPGGKP